MGALSPEALAALEELAALAGGSHPLAVVRGRPVPVLALLEGLNGPPALSVLPGGARPSAGLATRTPTTGAPVSVSVPVRMTAELLEELDALAVEMAAAGRPEVAATGPRWGRSSLMRLALTRGVAELRAEIRGGEA